MLPAMAGLQQDNSSLAMTAQPPYESEPCCWGCHNAVLCVGSAQAHTHCKLLGVTRCSLSRGHTPSSVLQGQLPPQWKRALVGVGASSCLHLEARLSVCAGSSLGLAEFRPPGNHNLSALPQPLAVVDRAAAAGFSGSSITHTGANQSSAWPGFQKRYKSHVSGHTPGLVPPFPHAHAHAHAHAPCPDPSPDLRTASPPGTTLAMQRRVR